mmetsp:Transcript_1483/g.6481  ORF Transcript_1483/g.6481 Transcript_1483/m.6481 type:complete len:339 (+) Transcript_1483:843-1859(+)
MRRVERPPLHPLHLRHHHFRRHHHFCHHHHHHHLCHRHPHHHRRRRRRRRPPRRPPPLLGRRRDLQPQPQLASLLLVLALLLLFQLGVLLRRRRPRHPSPVLLALLALLGLRFLTEKVPPPCMCLAPPVPPPKPLRPSLGRLRRLPKLPQSRKTYVSPPCPLLPLPPPRLPLSGAVCRPPWAVRRPSISPRTAAAAVEVRTATFVTAVPLLCFPPLLPLPLSLVFGSRCQRPRAFLGPFHPPSPPRKRQRRPLPRSFRQNSRPAPVFRPLSRRFQLRRAASPRAPASSSAAAASLARRSRSAGRRRRCAREWRRKCAIRTFCASAADTAASPRSRGPW